MCEEEGATQRCTSSSIKSHLSGVRRVMKRRGTSAESAEMFGEEGATQRCLLSSIKNHFSGVRRDARSGRLTQRCPPSNGG